MVDSGIDRVVGLVVLDPLTIDLPHERTLDARRQQNVPADSHDQTPSIR